MTTNLAGISPGARQAGLLVAMFAAPLLTPGRAAPLFPFTGDATVSTVWQDNVTNTSDSDEKLSALQFRAAGTAEQRRPFTRDTAFFFGGNVLAEIWPKYDGLDLLTAGPHLAVRHKFGLGPYAPALRLKVAGTGTAARETARAGWSAQALLTYAQRFDEALSFDAGAEWNRFAAHHAVFSKTSGSLFGNANYDLNERWRLKAGLCYRKSDVVSYDPAIWSGGVWIPADYDTLPGPSLHVTTFHDHLLAYRLRAHTWSYIFGVSPALGPHTALDFQVELSEIANREVRYINHLVSLSIVHHF